jgi:hypothetical protein
MRAFYLAYSISPQAVGKLEELPIFNIPWEHNIAIFEGIKSLEERLWTVGARSHWIKYGKNSEARNAKRVGLKARNQADWYLCTDK